MGILVALSLVLITVSFRQPTSGTLNGIESAGVTVMRPFEIAAERVARPFRDAYGYFHGLVHAKRENARLRAEVDQLRAQATQNQSAQEENVKLRDQLRYIDGPRFPSNYLPVNTRVISAAEISRCTCFDAKSVRTYTAPPGSPIPPSAMNTIGNPMESSGWLYLSGFSVR